MIELIPDSTIFYQWGIFIASILVLNFGVFQPALKIIQARRVATVGDEAEAERYENKIVELSERIDESLEGARREGQEIIQQLRQAAETASTETIRLARENMETQLKQVRSQLEQQSKEVELQLKQHAQEMAADLSSRVSGRHLGKEAS